jgi:3-oxoacyl-[acyl-carrier protein] reductase
MSATLHGQTAVVAGGTRGIGRAIALDLLQQGARVWALWHRNEAAAAALGDAAARLGGRLALARCDVSDEREVESFWRARETDPSDGIQICVASSGIRRDGVAAMMPLEQWRAVLDTNLTGSFLMAKQAVLAMLPRRYGRIVLITSPAAHFGFEGQANYSASKAGQIGLMRSLAREVARRGITVNCVSPGFVDTELLAGLSEDQKREYAARVPLKRFATPEEVAYAVRCLVAREAGYITGTTLEVTGGM